MRSKTWRAGRVEKGFWTYHVQAAFSQYPHIIFLFLLLMLKDNIDGSDSLENSLHPLISKISKMSKSVRQRSLQSVTTPTSVLLLTAMFASIPSAAAFFANQPACNVVGKAFLQNTAVKAAQKGQAEVVLVGCGLPNRGMGWYHAIQMTEKKWVW